MDKKLSPHAGTVIAARLDKLGKTQTWLAREAGVSANAVTKWIRTGQIARKNAIRVAELLEIEVGDLLAPDSTSRAVPLMITQIIERESKAVRGILINVSQDELELLNEYRYATPTGKLVIKSVATRAEKDAEQVEDETPH